jgi:preprotein translocase subunit Sss1
LKSTNKCPKKEMLISRNLWFYRQAHLILKKLVKPEQIETVKLIRSKGIGIYFITQNPMDVLAVSSSS